MKITVAIDSFKGSLPSVVSGKAVEEAAKSVWPSAEVFIRPLADGGEGTVDALCEGLGGEIVEVSVMGPTGKPVLARYAILKEKTAVIEMAAAAGITLVLEEERNPLKTTTFGVGEMIKDAIKRGCRKFIVGIGGSATNDGGMGMLSALGFDFLDKDQQRISVFGEGLEDLASISDENVIPKLKECYFRIACDVKNPLCGENGCSAVFGPQKGADERTVKNMDLWLKNYAEIAKKISKTSDMNFEGAGAAGGLGFAFLSFTSSSLESGIEIILEETRLEDYIKASDMVITGEGRLDSQTVMGKAPIGVASIAKKHGKKVIAFSGCVTNDADICNDYGIDAFFPILRNICTLEEALDEKNAYNNLVNTARQVFRLIAIKE